VGGGFVSVRLTGRPLRINRHATANTFASTAADTLRSPGPLETEHLAAAETYRITSRLNALAQQTAQNRSVRRTGATASAGYASRSAKMRL
jgi:hypothetical protein